MIYEIEEHITRDADGEIEPGSEIRFRNTRNSSRFIAFAGKTPGNWIVTRQGGPRSPGEYTPEQWGFVQQEGKLWFAVPGTLPSTQRQSCRERNEALDLVTNVPDGEHPNDAS